MTPEIESLMLSHFVAQRPKQRLRLASVAGLFLLSSMQTLQPRPAYTQNPASMSVPAKTWAEEATTNEIAIIQHADSYVRYRQHTTDSKRNEVRDIIESKDGTVARLVMRDNRPLTPEEDAAERDRLNSLLDNPNSYARHVRAESNSRKQAIDLIKVMPDAMIYSYAQDQTPSSASRTPQIVIDYMPNPHFSPPNTASEALSGLRGRIWIDTDTKSVVRMDGDIFQAVNFGWGMLAHIYPGGKLSLEQSTVVEGRWNMTHFNEHVAIKALMVKTISESSEISSVDFQKLSNAMSYQDAIKLLLSETLPK